MDSLYVLMNALRPLSGVGGGTAGTLLGKIITIVVTVAGGLIAIFLIYSIVKDAIAFAKGDGNGSVIKILGKVLFLIICIGLIFIVMNWQTLGERAQNIMDPLINHGTNIVNEIG